MVRKKKLSPSGAKDKEGNYNNAHLNLHRDELEAAGLEIGDEVFVRVRENKIIVQKSEASGEELQHDFGD
ncbi:MAG: AbrB/MazE/SpoVT family DNA-binding domain-containing protein [Candidatus Nanohaloarchaea archaeon]|nr:AbrB/MazE/SpoVT family DNA-binding domain-containing protein [Candidatus Nanohaloarchaea archaeon]